jgi:hypothetical protein
MISDRPSAFKISLRGRSSGSSAVAGVGSSPAGDGVQQFGDFVELLD